MISFRLVVAFLLLYLPLAYAAKEIPIWPGEKLAENNSVNFSKKPGVNNRAVTKVNTPEMIYIPPAGKSNHTALLIIPGGGFSYIMKDLEGINIASILSRRGYSSFVLIYRMPQAGAEQHRLAAFSDAQRALRMIRGSAMQYGIDAHRVGVMGFSAGAFLAANLSNDPDAVNYPVRDQQDRVSARPDFSALIYPVLSLKEGVTHPGTRAALYGKAINPQTIMQHSQEMRVSDNTPPTFLVQALNDNTASPQNSLLMFAALREHKVNTEMHLFQQGGHGFGSGQQFSLPVNSWLTLFDEWQSSLAKP